MLNVFYVYIIKHFTHLLSTNFARCLSHLLPPARSDYCLCKARTPSQSARYQACSSIWS